MISSFLSAQNPLAQKKYIFIGDHILWNFSNILLLPKDRHSTEDGRFIFLSDKEINAPVRAIPFSSYDGFALKNIFGNILKLPTILISSQDLYPEIIRRRCDTLGIESYFPNIKNKTEFIEQFCQNHQCTPRDIIYFEGEEIQPIPCNPTIISTQNSFNATETLSSEIFPEFIRIQSPHVIRKFAHLYAENLLDIQSYYTQTRHASDASGKNIREKRCPKVLICDIDGTCTDGSMIYADDGSTWKRFAQSDIRAIQNWNKNGHATFFITGENSAIPQKFAQLCAVAEDHVFANAGDRKAQILDEICEKYKIKFNEVAYVGDDMNDLGIIEYLLRENGTAGCPHTAMPKIKSIPGILVLDQPGGAGAVNRFIEILSIGASNVSQH